MKPSHLAQLPMRDAALAFKGKEQSNAPANDSRDLRRVGGFTLVELLIALTIASVLTIIALPAVKEAIQEGSLSRSADAVRAYLVNARAQAIRTGRPHGVVIQRNGSDMIRGGYATRLSFAAQPMPYTGEVLNAKAILLTDPVVAGGRITATFGFKRNECGRLWAAAQTIQNGSREDIDSLHLRPGAILKIAGDQTSFRIDSIVPQTVDGNPGVAVVATYPAPQLPTVSMNTSTSMKTDGRKFSIHGVPQGTFFPPLEIPGKAVIDLTLSGFGLAEAQFNPAVIRGGITVPGSEDGLSKVIVMFGPDGSVASVHHEVWNGAGYVVSPVSVASTIYLAVGRVDGVRSVSEIASHVPDEGDADDVPNFANTALAWISIRPSSGQVAASPVAPITETQAEFFATHGIDDSDSPFAFFTSRLVDSRQLAKIAAAQ